MPSASNVFPRQSFAGMPLPGTLNRSSSAPDLHLLDARAGAGVPLLPSHSTIPFSRNGASMVNALAPYKAPEVSAPAVCVACEYTLQQPDSCMLQRVCVCDVSAGENSKCW